MKDVKPDPRVAHEIAAEALRIGFAQRDSNVGAAIHNRYGRSMQSQDAFRAWRDAVGAEYDRLVAASLRQEEDVRAVRAVVDAAGKLPIPQYESMPELANALNALLEQFEDRINAVDEAESLARMRAFKAKLDAQSKNAKMGA